MKPLLWAALFGIGWAAGAAGWAALALVLASAAVVALIVSDSAGERQ